MKRNNVKAVYHFPDYFPLHKSELMQCSDGHLYVVKLLSLDRPRELATELFCWELARHLDLPVLDCVLVHTNRLTWPVTPVPFYPSSHRPALPIDRFVGFGIRYEPPFWNHLSSPFPELAWRGMARDWWALCENEEDLLGMHVFDCWVANLDCRQIWFRKTAAGHVRAYMIDLGHAFGGCSWNLTYQDSFYRLSKFLEQSSGRMQAVWRWLEMLEDRFDYATLRLAAETIPPKWYDFDRKALFDLLEQLERRRTQLRKRIRSELTYRALLNAS